MTEYSDFQREKRFRFLAPSADAALPNDGDIVKAEWARSTATRSYDRQPKLARKVFDVRAPRGERPCDTKQRAIKTMTNFILNTGSKFYDWLGEEWGVNVGWSDADGHCKGLRDVDGSRGAARAMEHWRKRHDEGTHAANDRIAERLQRLARIEVDRTMLVPREIEDHSEDR